MQAAAAGGTSGHRLQRARAPSPQRRSGEGYTKHTEGHRRPLTRSTRAQAMSSWRSPGHPGLSPQPQLTTAGATLAQPSHIPHVPRDPSSTCAGPLGGVSPACLGACAPGRLAQEPKGRASRSLVVLLPQQHPSHSPLSLLAPGQGAARQLPRSHSHPPRPVPAALPHPAGCPPHSWLWTGARCCPRHGSPRSQTGPAAQYRLSGCSSRSQQGLVLQHRPSGCSVHPRAQQGARCRSFVCSACSQPGLQLDGSKGSV